MMECWEQEDREDDGFYTVKIHKKAWPIFQALLTLGYFKSWVRKKGRELIIWS